MENEKDLEHSYKDISDDLLYLSEIIHNKSDENDFDITDEYEKLKEIIEKLEKI